MIHYDVIIAGGGASGLTAAVSAAENGESVLLLEASDRPGKKLLASGNGRCNIMNRGKLRYYGDSEFAKAVISRCNASVQTEFWHHLGVVLAEEDEGRVYPCTFHSATMMEAFKRALDMLKVSVGLNRKVRNIESIDNGFSVQTEYGERYLSSRVILATGGPAQPALGGNDFGFRLMLTAGHAVEQYHPSLCPVKTDPVSISGLSGIRTRCKVSLLLNDEELHQETGEVLFTDYGISGICVMQCARFIREDRSGYSIELDLTYPAFSCVSDVARELEDRKRRFASRPADDLANGFLNKKLAFAVMKQAGIPMKGEPICSLDHRQLQAVLYSLTHYRLHVSGLRGMKYAQTAAGGIRCSQINPANMESRLIPGLHLTGEMLNVDGDCGGFNLMFACATGILAGMNRI